MPTSLDSVRPVEVGSDLPVVRVTAPASDADSLANRALATACVLTSGDISATAELAKWAEAAAAGETYPQVGPIFDETSIGASSRTLEIAAAHVEVRRKVDTPWPDLEPGETDDGIGYEAALGIAEPIVVDLVDRGLLPNTETPLLHASQQRTTACSQEACSSFVESYGFWFAPEVAGLPVVGMAVSIDIHRSGEPLRIELLTADIEVVGEAVAAIDEGTADLRFLELAQAQYPDFEVFLDGPGRVVYLAPYLDEPTEVEPVWYAAWNSRTPSGIVGRPQPSSLSLTNADAELLPRGP